MSALPPDDERETARLLGQLKVEPSAAARERAFAHLQQEFAKQQAPAPSHGRRRWVIAAGLVLALAAGWMWRGAQNTEFVARVESLDGGVDSRGSGWFSGTAALAQGAQVSTRDSLSVADGAGVLLRISPDLTVRLAAGARARFLAANELELTQGQAFIDATPGAHAPLSVITPRGTVTHLGTQYLVRLEGDGVEVAVREGRAQLKSGALTSVAEAGRWVLHRDANTVPIAGDLEPADPRFDWIGALPSEFRLEGATLAGFLAWFQRETGLTPIYSAGVDAGKFSEVQLKGSIDDLAPLEALSYVLATADLAWHREGAKVIIEQSQAGAG
jgi:ferric-dicitrate binding protein FerR (iron transport regulator)